MTTCLNRGERKQLSDWIGRQCGLELLYKATRDGCDAAAFHRLCDNKGPTVTVMYNPEGSVYGGYISQTWQSSGSWTADGNAFIFRLRRNGTRQSIKFGIKPDGTGSACFLHNTYGPTFGGGHDLPQFTNTIQKSSDYFTLNGSLSFGTTYDMRGEDANSIYNGHQNVLEIEVYQVKGNSEMICIKNTYVSLIFMIA